MPGAGCCGPPRTHWLTLLFAAPPQSPLPSTACQEVLAGSGSDTAQCAGRAEAPESAGHPNASSAN